MLSAATALFGGLHIPISPLFSVLGFIVFSYSLTCLKCPQLNDQKRPQYEIKIGRSHRRRTTLKKVGFLIYPSPKGITVVSHPVKVAGKYGISVLRIQKITRHVSRYPTRCAGPAHPLR